LSDGTDVQPDDAPVRAHERVRRVQSADPVLHARHEAVRGVLERHAVPERRRLRELPLRPALRSGRRVPVGVAMLLHSLRRRDVRPEELWRVRSFVRALRAHDGDMHRELVRSRPLRRRVRRLRSDRPRRLRDEHEQRPAQLRRVRPIVRRRRVVLRRRVRRRMRARWVVPAEHDVLRIELREHDGRSEQLRRLRKGVRASSEREHHVRDE
jgi:hypothetical protein